MNKLAHTFLRIHDVSVYLKHTSDSEVWFNTHSSSIHKILEQWRGWQPLYSSNNTLSSAFQEEHVETYEPFGICSWSHKVCVYVLFAYYYHHYYYLDDLKSRKVSKRPSHSLRSHIYLGLISRTNSYFFFLTWVHLPNSPNFIFFIYKWKWKWSTLWGC